MSKYANAISGNKPKTPKSIDKLMGKKSWNIAKNKKKVLDENPGSYVISWMEVLTCAWTYMQTNYVTNGIFPPSLIIDRKHAPQTERYQTGAQVNVAWRIWRTADGVPTNIVPSYVELRIYHKNVMQIVYDKFKHTLPEPAMIAYMVNTAMHEYIHYLNYYDYNADVIEALKDEKISASEYAERLKKMDEFIFNRNTVQDEYKTEHDAILNTLQYMRSCYGDGINGGFLEVIPGGSYDLMCREKFGNNYRLASLMCEYLWMDLQEDFGENLTDKDYADINLRKKKIVHEFRKYTQKHPTKMLIIE